jgi:hypothetical protein
MAQGRNTAQKSTLSSAVPNDLEAFFMPFTANRAFKARPRLIARPRSGCSSRLLAAPPGHALRGGGIKECDVGCDSLNIRKRVVGPDYLRQE